MHYLCKHNILIDIAFLGERYIVQQNKLLRQSYRVLFDSNSENCTFVLICNDFVSKRVVS